ncbi:MAG: primase-helicase family protein [Candidatus Helarchaeota archaeon]
MLKTETIQLFLNNIRSPFRDLYNAGMECQVMVSPEGGTPIQGTYKNKKWKGYTDGNETWKNFRIPWNTSDKAIFEDTNLTWDFATHVKAIGLTGWNWINSESCYLSYDIDSLSGHKTGLTESELQEIEKTLSSIPWVTLVRSGGGKGLHLYLHLEKPVKTQNHNEHAALTRSLISVLTIKTGLNLIDKFDVVGGILWIWENRAEITKGLKYIKKAKEKFPISFIPKNWKDHLHVTTGKQKKVKLNSNISTIYAALKNISLQPTHHKLLKWFDLNSEHTFWFDSDWTMLVCHTLDLKKAHTELNLKGLFETISSGSSEQNCFCFPLLQGSWVVRRYRLRVKEHSIWTTDKKGWTKCLFNTEPSFEQIMKFNGGLENSKGEFIFSNLKKLEKSLLILGFKEELTKLDAIQVSIKKKENKIFIKIFKKNYPVNDLNKCNLIQKMGFATENNFFIKVLTTQVESKLEDSLLPDEIIRAVISNNQHAGWYALVKDKWVLHPDNNIRTIINTHNPELNPKEVVSQMGEALINPWEIVAKPFEPEYLGNRQWNKNSPQIATIPVQGNYPYWEKVLLHCGSYLTPFIKENKECKKMGIFSGSEYLFTWLANMLQNPTLSVPFLFFTGSQNCGKSTFHEAASLLLKNKKGYVKCNNVIENSSGFNGEFLGAILAVIEEIDLRKTRIRDKIKDWVTGLTLLITEKFKTSIEITNCLHFVQCSNNANYFLMLPGDTRTTIIYVNPPEQEIPKNILMEHLKKEVPYILYDLLNVKLEQSQGRLAIPIIESELRLELIHENKSLLEKFIQERMYNIKGVCITWQTFYTSFSMWLDTTNPSEKYKWGSHITSKEFPHNDIYPKGKMGQFNKTYIGNMSLTDEDPKNDYKYVKKNGRLIEEKLKKEERS